MARTSSLRILVQLRRCLANTFLQALTAMALLGLAGCCLVPGEPPGGDYKRVSELVRFPDFYPGLGRFYVQPKTLPLGPFRAYDRQGFLASTIYMVPMKDLDAHTMMGTQPAPQPTLRAMQHHKGELRYLRACGSSAFRRSRDNPTNSD